MTISTCKLINPDTALTTVVRAIKTPLMKIITVSAAINLLVNSVYADTSVSDNISIEEIMVVTGTRTAKKLQDSPVSIDVIAGEDIEAVTVGTLEKALELLPGVYFNRSEKDGFNILMRGFDGDRVLVLIDGQRLLSPTGSSVDFAQISALRIKRIEIVKGAASAAYGSDAMGGVINIITDQPLGSELRLTQKSGVNSNNTFEEYSHHSQLAGAHVSSNWGIQGSLQKISDPSFRHEGVIQNSIGTVERESTISQVQANLNTNNVHGRYKVQIFNEDKLRPQGSFPGGGLNYYTSEVDRTTQSLITTWSGHEIKTQSANHEEISGNRGSLRFTDIFLHEIENQFTFGSKSLEWITGGRFYQEGLDQHTEHGVVEIDNKKRTGAELFLQADYLVKDKFEIVAGGRAQENEDFGFHSAFRTNAKVDVNLTKAQSMKLRFHAGQGYKVPTIKQNHYIFDHSGLASPYMVIGNPYLVPEETVSIGNEIELISKLAEHTQLTTSFSAHQSISKNHIFINPVNYEQALSAVTLISPSLAENFSDNGSDYHQYINIEKTRMRGFDIDVSLHHKNTRYGLNYNYLDARDQSTHARLADRPYHQIKTSISTQFLDPAIDLMVFATYQNDVQEPADQSTIVNNEFTIFNASIKHQLFDQFSWKLGADNIFDIHRKTNISVDEFDARPLIGRFVYISFDYQLD